MDVFSTLITPVEQAGLWRQGRTEAEIEMKALAFENAKAPFLATSLRKGRARETNIVTDDLPGYSWQQWGEAAQLVWIDSTNHLNWSKDWLDKPERLNGYRILEKAADKLGLSVTSPHTLVSLRAKTPREIYSVVEIDQEMRQRYGTSR